MWLYIGLLCLSLGSSIFFVLSAFFVPILKLPQVLRKIHVPYFNRLYQVYTIGLFLIAIGFSITTVNQFELIRALDYMAIARFSLSIIALLSGFAITNAFKKQKLSRGLIVLSGVVFSTALFIFSKEATPMYLEYLWVIFLLALFFVLRYVVHIFTKKF